MEYGVPGQQPLPEVETPKLHKSENLGVQLLEIINGLDLLFQQERELGTGLQTNPALYRVSYLITDYEDTRFQWCNNLANIGLPDDEQVYEIRRELSRDMYRTDQKVLTITIKSGGVPNADLMSVRGSTDSAGAMINGAFISEAITDEAINQFRISLKTKQDDTKPVIIPRRFR